MKDAAELIARLRAVDANWQEKVAEWRAIAPSVWTDDVVKKLRPTLETEAADHIETLEARVATLSAALEWRPTHRHMLSNREYAMVGQCQVQCKDGLTDYEVAIVYRGKDGELWVRRKSEFDDRFTTSLTAREASR